MRKSIIKKIVSVSVLISGLIFGATIALAQSNLGGGNYVSVTAAYHVEANKIVNDQFSDLFTYFSELEITDEDYLSEMQRLLLPPSQDDSLSQQEVIDLCQNNLSSFCLQTKLSSLYLTYQQEVSQFQNTLTSTANLDLNSVSTIDSTPSKFIEEQLNVIAMINKQSIEFYRQALFAYPMHIQNQQIIDNLKELINNLRDLENQLEPYPSIFHNVTTTECI
jgi:hypothetical protein